MEKGVIPINAESLHIYRWTKMKKWKDLTVHRAGCPYKGVAVYGTDAEIAKYHSGNCPSCNVLVKWEEEQQEKQTS
jgi:hypothetical protein